jgi:hypothetical protein
VTDNPEPERNTSGGDGGGSSMCAVDHGDPTPGERPLLGGRRTSVANAILLNIWSLDIRMNLPMATGTSTPEFDADAVVSASNVMLLTPSLGTEGSDVCGDLLSVERPSEENVLAVILNDSPDGWLDRWERTVGPERPAKTSFVTANEQTRSVAAGASGGSALPASMTIHTTPSPGDLTGLGMRISDQLGDWQADDNQIVVEFDSLTTLLEYSDRQSVFKFMHVLKGRVEAADALAHYHMDPAAHSTEELNTFKSLMDAVVEVESDGTHSVSSR